MSRWDVAVECRPEDKDLSVIASGTFPLSPEKTWGIIAHPGMVPRSPSLDSFAHPALYKRAIGLYVARCYWISVDWQYGLCQYI